MESGALDGGEEESKALYPEDGLITEGKIISKLPLKELNTKRSSRKWEKRWILQPNVIDQGGEIWIQKWVCVENLTTVNVPATTTESYSGLSPLDS